MREMKEIQEYDEQRKEHPTTQVWILLKPKGPTRIKGTEMPLKRHRGKARTNPRFPSKQKWKGDQWKEEKSKDVQGTEHGDNGELFKRIGEHILARAP